VVARRGAGRLQDLPAFRRQQDVEAVPVSHVGQPFVLLQPLHVIQGKGAGSTRDFPGHPGRGASGRQVHRGARRRARGPQEGEVGEGVAGVAHLQVGPCRLGALRSRLNPLVQTASLSLRRLCHLKRKVLA